MKELLSSHSSFIIPHSSFPSFLSFSSPLGEGRARAGAPFGHDLG
jgi:hypothetical protein